MTMSRLSGTIWLCCVLAAGCANYTKPVALTEPATIGQRNFDAVWQASLDVLGDYFFRIERQDRREGLIVTEPLTGRQAWEFWRRDAVTPYDKLESTLQTIYRQVSVRAVPVEGEVNVYQAVVDANTYRSDRTELAVESVSQAYSMFMLPGGNSDPDATAVLGYERTLVGLPGYQAGVQEAAGRQLVSLGPDPDLAARIAGQINQRAAQLRGQP
jgi:hypothetical protein